MDSNEKTRPNEIAMRKESNMLPYYSLENASRGCSGNHSPSESDWRYSMERRMERMERTMNRAANIMDSYFGNTSPINQYIPSDKVLDQLQYTPKPCLTSGPCNAPAFPPLDSYNQQTLKQADSNIPRIDYEDLRDDPTTPVNLTNQPLFFSPRGCRCVAPSAPLPTVIEEFNSGRRPSVSVVPDPVATNTSETYVTDLNPATTIIVLTPSGGRTTVKINVKKE